MGIWTSNPRVGGSSPSGRACFCTSEAIFGIPSTSSEYHRPYFGPTVRTLCSRRQDPRCPGTWPPLLPAGILRHLRRVLEGAGGSVRRTGRRDLGGEAAALGPFPGPHLGFMPTPRDYSDNSRDLKARSPGEGWLLG